MLILLLVLNLIASLASAGWAVVAMFRPGWMSTRAQVDLRSSFYARMYAVRSVPFGVAAGLLPFLAHRPAIAWILFLASSIQIADAVIAIGEKDRGMLIGALCGAVVHAACGWALLCGCI